MILLERCTTPPELRVAVPTTTFIELPALPTVQCAEILLHCLIYNPNPKNQHYIPAVTVHLFEIILPPQKWKLANVRNETCHGMSAIFAPVPPTIRPSRSSSTAMKFNFF